MQRLAEFSSVVSDIYDCAVDPARWPATLGRICEQMNGAYVAVNLVDKHAQAPRHSLHSPWDAGWMARLAPYMFEIPGTESALFGPIDCPSSTLANVPEDQFVASRFYREWVAPQGLKDGGSVKVIDTANTIGMLSFVVSARRPPVTCAELGHIQYLAPHIRRALMIGDLIGQRELELQRYRTAMDGLAAPLILTDAAGRIHFANRAAAGLIAAGDALHERQGRLEAADPARRAAFADALARAHRGDREIGPYGIGLPLSGADAGAATPCGGPVIGYVLPLNQSDTRHLAGGATVAVVLSTAAGETPVIEAVLATLFALTPAEIRICRGVAGGEGLREIGARAGISENTVKTHMRHIFDKTGVSRQSELARLLAALAPPLGG